MHERKTVLILGAGASWAYGFYTGAELIKRICERFEDLHAKLTLDDNKRPELRTEGRAFAQTLRRSGATSIDAFLEHRPELRETGKVAIASVLLPCEKEDALFDWHSDRAADHWYGYLWRYLAADGEQHLTQRPVRIVTFNYDRSLEQYLWITAQNMFGVGPGRAGELVSRMDIIHVHGQLGRLPWQDGDGPVVPYGGMNRVELVAATRNAAKGIWLICEDEAARSGLAKARRLVVDARVLGFIGFGYHRTNLNRLLGDMGKCAGTITGSALGLTEAERDEIATYIGQLVAEEGHKPSSKGGGKVHVLGKRNLSTTVELRDFSNLTFLRESPCLLRD